MQLGAAALDSITSCGRGAGGDGEPQPASAACVAERPPAGLPVIALLLNRFAWAMSHVLAAGRPRSEHTPASAAARPSGTAGTDGLSGTAVQPVTEELATADVRHLLLPSSLLARA